MKALKRKPDVLRAAVTGRIRISALNALKVAKKEGIPKGLEKFTKKQIDDAAEEAVSATCETERFEAEDGFPPATRRWMVLTHRDTAARAMVWFEMPEKVRTAPVGVTDEILGHRGDGRDIVVAHDDAIRMRRNPS